MKKIIKHIVLPCAMAVACAGLLTGCGAYYYQSAYSPAPVYSGYSAPYANEFYFYPEAGAYYCYYPNQGWAFWPGVPPAGAVFWDGPAPGYLPPPPFGYAVCPPPPIFIARTQFYFDRDNNRYFYRDRDNHWRLYAGRPPVQARFFRGPRPALEVTRQQWNRQQPQQRFNQPNGRPQFRRQAPGAQQYHPQPNNNRWQRQGQQRQVPHYQQAPGRGPQQAHQPPPGGNRQHNPPPANGKRNNRDRRDQNH
ncbi:MAG: hypothetical protein HKL96_02985 [Phycisphaerales bacterium]|nr:hypothetical protein [Phycisphaerales bacterium]